MMDPERLERVVAAVSALAANPSEHRHPEALSPPDVSELLRDELRVAVTREAPLDVNARYDSLVLALHDALLAEAEAYRWAFELFTVGVDERLTHTAARQLDQSRRHIVMLGHRLLQYGQLSPVRALARTASRELLMVPWDLLIGIDRGAVTRRAVEGLVAGAGRRIGSWSRARDAAHTAGDARSVELADGGLAANEEMRGALSDARAIATLTEIPTASFQRAVRNAWAIVRPKLAQVADVERQREFPALAQTTVNRVHAVAYRAAAGQAAIEVGSAFHLGGRWPRLERLLVHDRLLRQASRQGPRPSATHRTASAPNENAPPEVLPPAPGARPTTKPPADTAP